MNKVTGDVIVLMNIAHHGLLTSTQLCVCCLESLDEQRWPSWDDSLQWPVYVQFYHGGKHAGQEKLYASSEFIETFSSKTVDAYASELCEKHGPSQLEVGSCFSNIFQKYFAVLSRFD